MKELVVAGVLAIAALIDHSSPASPDTRFSANNPNSIGISDCGNAPESIGDMVVWEAVIPPEAQIGGPQTPTSDRSPKNLI